MRRLKGIKEASTGAYLLGFGITRGYSDPSGGVQFNEYKRAASELFVPVQTDWGSSMNGMLDMIQVCGMVGLGVDTYQTELFSQRRVVVAVVVGSETRAGV